MNPTQLSELLRRSELCTLDFKLEHYDFSGATPDEKQRKRAEFAKDIICMANTPREESAYIVIGVKRRLDGTNELKGVPSHVDDNLLQQQLDGLVYPHPEFHYEQVELDDHQFGVIEIPVDRKVGPLLPVKDAVGLRRNVLYWRRGTQNAEADPAGQAEIHQWFSGATATLPPRVDGNGDWSRFVSIADVTEVGRQYVLVLAAGRANDPDGFKHLAWIDWSLVVDLDTNSESSGVLSRCRSDLEARRAIHRVTKGDDIVGNPNRATFWYFARGIFGRHDSLSIGTYAQWNMAFGEDLRRKLARFAAASSDPVVLIALWSSPQMEPFVRKILESAAALLGNRLTSVIVTEVGEDCHGVAEDTGAIVCRISTRHFLEGLATLQTIRRAGADNVIRLPGLDGVQKEVPAADLAWLE